MKCKSCHHDCHCNEELHADEYGVCVCDNCKCGINPDNRKFDEDEFNGA